MAVLDPFIHRYELDTSAPTRAQARSDALRRALAPALALWVVITAVGLLIVGPLDSLPGEVGVNEELQADRTPLLDTLTGVWSNIGQTESIIIGCLLILGLVWWRTKQWWLAIVPSLAVAIQAAVFMTSSLVVGRERPDVEPLDEVPPTSGYPSGHTGASIAFYVTLALLSRRIKNPVLRWAATLVCVLIPLLVGFARLYRGLHHPTDVAMGAVNGLTCVVLGWCYLRRDTSDADGSDAGVLGARERVDAVGGEPQRGEDEQHRAERQVGERA